MIYYIVGKVFKYLKKGDRMKSHINRKGVGLVGIVISLVLISIIAVVGFNVHVFLLQHLIREENMLTATYLASSQIEHLKEMAREEGFENVSTGSHPIDKSDLPDEASFILSYNTTELDWVDDTDPATSDYKQIVVTCNYPPHNDSVELVGYIVR